MIFYGAGGHAKVVIEAWIASGGEVTAIFDDNDKIKTLLGKSITGVYSAAAFPGSKLVITVGNNNIRRDIAHRVKNPFGKVIHPNTIISPSSDIREGTVVMAGSIIQAEARIGKHAIVNTAASIDHDCYIGDYVHVAPRVVLCGDVRVGEGALIGAGSTILPGVSIGNWAVVGAGSVVISDVPNFATVVGVPSKLRS
jgi:sugar O-acyltransferase (sialic acid O-acetyltransferase NeuD family)